MKMKLWIIICYALFFSGLGCSENETFVYETKPAVYFNAEVDSVNFSFAGQLKDTAIVKLEVALLGRALTTEKKYALRINPEKTTAIEGLHYKALNQEQVFPINSFKSTFPLEVYRKDKELLNKTVYIDLSIIDTEEIDAGYSNKIHIRVGITNGILKPIYWDSYLKNYYAEYSIVKHNVCLAIQKHDFPPTLKEAKASPYGASYWGVMGRAACTYFMENPTLDENNNKIEVWNPF